MSNGMKTLGIIVAVLVLDMRGSSTVDSDCH